MKEKFLRALNSFKILLSYLCCVSIMVLYTLFVDGDTGVLLVAFMVLVPLVSLADLLIVKGGISVGLECPSNDLKKGSIVDVVVRFTKGSIVPTPFINVTIGHSAHLECVQQSTRLKVCMAFEKSLECRCSVKANVSGSGRVYLQDVYLYDYLGFFRVKLNGVSSSVEVYVTPEVRDIDSSQVLFKSICNSIISNDEEEESQQDSNLSINSTLGYLHREYVAGDSPKRINWKLSCKRNRLMVRLDEPSPQSKPCIVLDMSKDTTALNPLKSLQNFETLVESALALASMCVKNGVECTFNVCNCQTPRELPISSIDDVYNLALAVSHCHENNQHRMPQTITSLKSSESMYIVFTDVFEGGLKADIDVLTSRGFAISTILSPRYYGQYSEPNVWIVNGDVSISKSEY